MLSVFQSAHCEGCQKPVRRVCEPLTSHASVGCQLGQRCELCCRQVRFRHVRASKSNYGPGFLHAVHGVRVVHTNEHVPGDRRRVIPSGEVSVARRTGRVFLSSTPSQQYPCGTCATQPCRYSPTVNWLLASMFGTIMSLRFELLMLYSPGSNLCCALVICPLSQYSFLSFVLYTG